MSARESEILLYLALGLSVARIEEKLCHSPEHGQDPREAHLPQARHPLSRRAQGPRRHRVAPVTSCEEMTHARQNHAEVIHAQRHAHHEWVIVLPAVSQYPSLQPDKTPRKRGMHSDGFEAWVEPRQGAMEMSEKEKISRRGFLSGVGAGALGVAALGCAAGANVAGAEEGATASRGRLHRGKLHEHAAHAVRDGRCDLHVLDHRPHRRVLQRHEDLRGTTTSRSSRACSTTCAPPSRLRERQGGWRRRRHGRDPLLGTHLKEGVADACHAAGDGRHPLREPQGSPEPAGRRLHLLRHRLRRGVLAPHRVGSMEISNRFVKSAGSAPWEDSNGSRVHRERGAVRHHGQERRRGPQHLRRRCPERRSRTMPDSLRGVRWDPRRGARQDRPAHRPHRRRRRQVRLPDLLGRRKLSPVIGADKINGATIEELDQFIENVGTSVPARQAGGHRLRRDQGRQRRRRSTASSAAAGQRARGRVRSAVHREPHAPVLPT